ncbi:MAG: hypothetical protein Q7U34_07960 [Anaerolineales bacterium]|nr:hypothetical protein [Anaerolineales bacterium]MDP3183780.1 hypothetical protein [Anaerolineales bacterium]
MASWIVHLRIAENLLGFIPGLEPARFAVGNIAPDSGMPDEKWENFTPPPRVTHFRAAEGELFELADLEFYRRYLLPLRNTPDPRFFSFRLGYFFHLVTDNLWSVKIGLPTKERFAAQFNADKDFIWEVKKDWYGLDFIYIRDHPDCLFWRVFLNCQAEICGLDFLLPEGLRWSVAHIQQYYQRTGEEIQALYNRPYIYLSQAEMGRFVSETTQHLLRIYRYLWIQAAETDGLCSALSCEPPSFPNY